jgi:NAD(P)-dependent dehydrogenase (short-subunit alcohol dehydrogenase family)
VDEASFDRLLAVNVRELFFVPQAVARHMMARGCCGSVIDSASQTSRRAEAPSSVHATTRAVISITRSAALARLSQDAARRAAQDRSILGPLQYVLRDRP